MSPILLLFLLRIGSKKLIIVIVARFTFNLPYPISPRPSPTCASNATVPPLAPLLLPFSLSTEPFHYRQKRRRRGGGDRSGAEREKEGYVNGSGGWLLSLISILLLLPLAQLFFSSSLRLAAISYGSDLVRWGGRQGEKKQGAGFRPPTHFFALFPPDWRHKKWLPWWQCPAPHISPQPAQGAKKIGGRSSEKNTWNREKRGIWEATVIQTSLSLSVHTVVPPATTYQDAYRRETVQGRRCLTSVGGPLAPDSQCSCTRKTSAEELSLLERATKLSQLL